MLFTARFVAKTSMESIGMWGLKIGTLQRPLSFARCASFRGTSPQSIGKAHRKGWDRHATTGVACSKDFSVSAASVSSDPGAQTVGQSGSEFKVRFAPSPTGNLHVGGARTALFNWLLAKHSGGKFVLRVEDTDKARSTTQSELAVMKDLKWLGLTWDEGPDVGGPSGPYRQSERTDIYKKYVDDLVAQGVAYPCFCTDEELELMKKEAEAKKLPPIYRGPWGSASKDEVQAMLDADVPHCYRFKVPKDQLVTIKDKIRGDVTWNTDTLGDFVILRSNGLPTYNFCVAVDDALMGISHVVRAEEHLPNTLRQVLIYRALGFSEPTFGHVSLILAPDKSKLSKRHGATSVGEFREEGFLAEAMVNYLSLLGWNDGTEQEIYTTAELQEKFSLDRVTKSAAVFDKAKLSWMNGQHLRALPDEEILEIVSGTWFKHKVLNKKDGPFVESAIAMIKESLDVATESIGKLEDIIGYPLYETANSEAAQPFIEDGLKDFAKTLLAAYESGDLKEAIKDNGAGFGKWLKALGKSEGRKGKRLFMPARIAFTGRMQGPDVGKVLALLESENGEVNDRSTFVGLEERMEKLQMWVESQE